MFDLVDNGNQSASILVIGVGTVGCNISKKIDTIYKKNDCVKFLYVHTSCDFLNSVSNNDSNKLEIKNHIHYNEVEIGNHISGKDIIFLIAGLGGDTGSDASPFIAKIVSTCGILCVGLFSFPFSFEGRKKINRAQKSYFLLKKYVDSMICIENDIFLDVNLRNKSLSAIEDLFSDSNKHFLAVIRGLVELIISPGMINVDFADVRTVISGMGLSSVGYSVQKGESRAEIAVKNLLKSPAFENRLISLSKGCIVNITAGVDLSLGEYATIGSAVEEFVSHDATVVVGTCIDPNIEGDMEVTVIVTGLPDLLFDEKFDDNEGFDVVTISKSIEFEPHHVSAGLSILTYFNDFVQQKYSGTETKVKIEQNGSTVSLIIETPSGEVERIEKTLHEFGMVVVGQKSPSDVLEKKMDIERLQMKLEMAAMELRYNEKIMLLYKSESESNKDRILVLEDQLAEMQRVISKSLSLSQKQLSIQFSAYKDIPKNIIKIIQKNIDSELTDDSRDLIRNEILKYKDDEVAIFSLKKLVENSMYGVTGNSLFSFIVHVLNSFPK